MKTSREPSISESARRDRRRSLTLLLIHLAACGSAALGVTLLFNLHLRLPDCMFYRVTGLYCLTCGATRAAYELAHLRVVNSLLLNPVSAMLAAWLLYAMICELIGAIRGERIRVRGGFWYLIAVLIAAAVYCVLRNVGIAPIPSQIFR